MKQVPRMRCPIAYSLDLIGDRWSLVIVRDMLMGKKRFSHFLESSEHITASVLANRLEQLENVDLICKEAYQSNPVRFEYALTARGNALLPVLKELCTWGNKQFPSVGKAPERFMRMRLLQ